MTGRPSPPQQRAGRGRSVLENRWLQVTWGLGLVLSPLAGPFISLLVCMAAVGAYRRSPARRAALALAAVIAVIDVVQLITP